MSTTLFLTPRYSLDADCHWLLGIDPVRRYWININGDRSRAIAIPGLVVSSLGQLKDVLIKFRALNAGGFLCLPTYTAQKTEIHCVGENLYSIAMLVEGAETWHLFDYESIEAFLLTAHPDWQASPQDVALGRDLLQQSWQSSMPTELPVQP